MAAEEKSEVTASPTGEAPSGGNSKLVMILTVVNLVATLGMVAVLVVSFQRDKKQPTITDISTQDASHGEGEKKEGDAKQGDAAHGEGKDSGKKKADFGRMVTLEQFTVNLATPGSSSPKYARVNISIEVPTEDAEGEVNQKMPQVRNAIIDLFNSKRPADLATPDGRDYLKDEIKNALNGFMVTGKVKGVFFTNFAVSS